MEISPTASPEKSLSREDLKHFIDAKKDEIIHENV